jgi:hypothetical protein
MKPKTKREEVLLEVIKELVKERNKLENRSNHPLPKAGVLETNTPDTGRLNI